MDFQVSPVNHIFVVQFFGLESRERRAVTHIIQAFSLPNTPTYLCGTTYLTLIYHRTVNTVYEVYSYTLAAFMSVLVVSSVRVTSGCRCGGVKEAMTVLQICAIGFALIYAG